MLLRRVMDNLQEQNWLAVILDFFIVVLGIVVAFQLQAWGQDRAAQRRAEQSLYQLYEESEKILAEWVKDVEYNDRRLELQDRTVAALHKGDRSDVSDKDLARGLGTMSHFPTISPPRRVYDELRSAGLLREINAPEALAAVSNYYEHLGFIQGQIEFFRPSAGDLDLRYGRGLNTIYDPNSAARRRFEIDFEVLAADPQYVNTMVTLLRNRIVFQIYRRGTMERASEMCVAIAAAVGENCQGFPDYEEVNRLPEWQVQDVPPREGEDKNPKGPQ